MAGGPTRGRLAAAFDLALKVAVTAILLGIATLTFIDVIGRYIFRAPVPGAFELQEFCMAILIFAGLPLVTRSGGHITVSLFDGLFQRSPALYRAKTVLVHVASAGILGFVTYCLAIQAIRAGHWGSVSAFLELPHYPVIWFMTGMAGIASLIFLGLALAAARGRAERPADGGTLL